MYSLASECATLGVGMQGECVPESCTNTSGAQQRAVFQADLKHFMKYLCTY